LICFEFIEKFVVLSRKKQQQQQQNLPLKIFIPYFVALLVFSGMELFSKLFKNSFEISTKREAAAIVLVGFQNREFRYSMTITNSSLVA